MCGVCGVYVCVLYVSVALVCAMCVCIACVCEWCVCGLDVEGMRSVYGACGVYVCVYVVYKYGRSVCGVCVEAWAWEKRTAHPQRETRQTRVGLASYATLALC